MLRTNPLPPRTLPAPALAELAPMLFSESKATPANESAYIAEIKYDGYRVLAEFEPGRAELRTRNGADCSRWFPEVTAALATVNKGSNVVDGEMAVLDELGRSDFDELQERARRRRRRPSDKDVTYCVFDILVHDGRNVMSLPLIERKALLKAILQPAPGFVLYVGHFECCDVDNPVSALYQQALGLKLEGVVAKRMNSLYRPGERTCDWVKLKRPGAIPAQRFSRKG